MVTTKQQITTKQQTESVSHKQTYPQPAPLRLTHRFTTSSSHSQPQYCLSLALSSNDQDLAKR